MPQPTSHAIALALSSALLTGCPAADHAETEADTGAGLTTDAGTETVELALVLKEYGVGSPIDGASVTFDGMSRTTDSAGEATIAVAKNATSALRVTKADFPDYTIYVTMLEADRGESHDLGSDATLSALAAAMGLTRDPTKGLLSVGVLAGTPADKSPLAGATISIDAASDVQMVFDSSAPVGFSLGDTTLPGSSSASIFANVTPGTVTPTVTPPSGYTCDLGPESVEVVANGYTIVNYYCHL